MGSSICWELGVSICVDVPNVTKYPIFNNKVSWAKTPRSQNMFLLLLIGTKTGAPSFSFFFSFFFFSPFFRTPDFFSPRTNFHLRGVSFTAAEFWLFRVQFPCLVRREVNTNEQSALQPTHTPATCKTTGDQTRSEIHQAEIRSEIQA